ncbi:TonB-dependent receptor [Pseudoalteromonas rubra]|nr:TonB-dependent receptor [Pseudoalteromonas rubra]
MLNSKISKAVRLALVFGSASTAAFATQVQAEAGAEEEKVERIEVTGSRIKRTDLEGPSPVQVFDKEYLEQTGSQTVTDFLFQSSFAGPGMTSESATLAQGAGSANFDARGFGDDYTVFLVNGRRLPGSPTGGDAAADLNLIPMAAVERIEFLADGASAIYGADAISGVINIITKRDFEGLSVKAQYGANVEHNDGQRTSFEIVGGTSGDNHSTLFAFDYFKQRTVDAVDRPLANSASSITGADGRSPTGLPGTWVTGDFSESFPVEGCPQESIRAATVVDNGTECAYDFAQLYQVAPLSERFNIFVDHKHQFGESVSVFVEARHSRSRTEVRNGAAPGFFSIPADAAENPFGEDMFMIRRTVDAGPRSRDGVNTLTALATGFDWYIDDQHTLSAYYNKSWANNNQMGISGNISEDRFSKAVEAGLISLVNDNRKDGQFIADVFTVKPHTAADGKDYWTAIPTHRQGELREEVANISISGTYDILEGFGWVLGAESRQERYFDFTDIAQIDDDVAGGAASFGQGGREFQSVYSELSVMPLEPLEVSLALRHDSIETDISDLGSKTTYKVALSYRPTDSLLLRASTATGFKAPILNELYLGKSFGVASAIDTTRCAAEGGTQCEEREIRSATGGNPNLAPEESTSYNLGISWEIMDGFNATVDYWNIEVEGMIGTLDTQEILNNEAQYPDLVKRVGGSVSHPDAEVRSNFQNLNEQSGDGMDINLTNTFDAFGGKMTVGLKSSYLMSMERQTSAVQPLCDDAGTTSEPEWRHNLRTSWETADYGASVAIRYVGETADHPGSRKSGTCEWARPDDILEVDSYTQVDLQGFYYLETGTKLTVGMRNLFDEEPPYSEQAANRWPWYDQALYDNMGRYLYFSVSHKF